MQLGIFDLSLGEIMLFFQNEWVVGWLLIGSGILAAAWLLENLTDPIPLLRNIFDVVVAIGTYVGFFVGLLDILVGYIVYTTNPTATIVAAVLIITGFSLSMRLLSKFPIALLFAAGVAGFVTFTVYGYVKPYTSNPIQQIADIATQVVSLKGMIVIFLVVFSVAYVLGGLIIKIIQLIGKVFSATPVSVIIGLAAMAVGVIVILAPALVGVVVPWPPM
ncbi:MAG: hypothetical protein HXY34_03970 [Candidatus Thorarchaeota archaeon]|nr:hypothetical protein [Candidatus Thorarchaeota archaeon]